MKRLLVRAAFALLISATLVCVAPAQNSREHLITVSSTASVQVRPDLGILVLAIRSSGPLAADAVAQVAKKASDVQSALSSLGYPPGSFKIGPVTFARAGGPYYAPNLPSITGIEASQQVYVFFKGSELGMNRKIAAAIDALSKAGASTPSLRIPLQQQGAMVLYTVKNPVYDEAQAFQKAMDEDHERAQAIARQMHVQITGLCCASAFVRPYPQPAYSQLQDLPYRYYSTESDEVQISQTVTLNYDFK